MPRRDVLEQVLSDQEAGDDEENVDPGEAAGQERGADVIGHYAQHREGAQSFDVQSEQLLLPNQSHECPVTAVQHGAALRLQVARAARFGQAMGRKNTAPGVRADQSVRVDGASSPRNV